MNHKHIYLLAISFFLNTVACKRDKEETKPVSNGNGNNVIDSTVTFPNCYDGILNNEEIDIDCGGPNCQPCDHCTNGLWEPWLGETWVDCGGPCMICPTCANGILDIGESGIDCGGECGPCELLCGDGLLNGYEDQIDCDNQADILQGGCDYCPTCVDGIMNGTETGVDCGGDSCQAC